VKVFNTILEAKGPLAALFIKTQQNVALCLVENVASDPPIKLQHDFLVVFATNFMLFTQVFVLCLSQTSMSITRPLINFFCKKKKKKVLMKNAASGPSALKGFTFLISLLLLYSFPVGKIAEKAVCKSVFLTIWQYIGTVF